MIDVGKMIFDEISAKSRQAKKRNSYQFINMIMILSIETKIRDWSLDIFDPSGRYLCSYLLPESMKLDHVDRAGHLYFVQRMPFPKVIKYQLELNEFFP